MADNRSEESRSALMSRIGGKNTAPEMIVRKLLHSLGFRFRLHRRDLPGTPDIVLPRLKTAVFVHGCFWHGHGCKIGLPPKSRQEYWLPKIERNKARDVEKATALEAQGWRVLEIWQCETRDSVGLAGRLARELDKEPDEKR
jgi:DNA mismatch endonuclease (patch repair protein)